MVKCIMRCDEGRRLARRWVDFAAMIWEYGCLVWLAAKTMKTTVDLSDDLLRRARRAAMERNTTLRALLEESLVLLLGPDDQPAPPVRFVTFGSPDELLPDQALDRVERELARDPQFPVEDADWWMKRFGFLPSGVRRK